MKMMLLTKKNIKDLPAIGSTDGQGGDAVAVVKFFDPTGSWTWYATEYNPETGEFFGLVDGHEKELGYFQLEELASFRGRFGLGIERDRYFSPKPLREIAPNKFD